MIDHADATAEFRDVEEMVQAAGAYLEVTDDLRPYTLEEARRECREASTRSWIALVAVVVVFLAMCVGALRGSPPSTPPVMAGVGADGDQLYDAASQAAADANVDPSWSLVDEYSELRRRQASLIKGAF
jgi:hypothetical protein